MKKGYALASLSVIVITLVLGISISLAQNIEEEPVLKLPKVKAVPPSPRIPDIMINSFDISRSDILVNESLSGSFSVDVINKNFNEFNSILTINGHNNQTFSIKNSGKYDISPVTFSNPGLYILSITLDYDDKVTETNESNNVVSVYINVTLPWSQPEVNDTLQQNDISIKTFRLGKNEIFENDSIGGEVEVEIIGNSSYNVIIFVNDTNYKENFELNSSGIYMFSPIIFATAGNYTVGVLADPENIINEVNESNNFAYFGMLVKSSGIPGNTTTGNETAENQTEIEEPQIDIPSLNITFNITSSRRPSSRTYIYFGGTVIATVDNESETLYYHQDSQKNVRLVTDGDGNLKQNNHFEPFGNAIHLTSFIYNKKLMAQKEIDLSSFAYFGARYYDKDTGRWTSSDPIHDSLESGYSYIKNNPFFYEDPDGKQAKVIGGWTFREWLEQGKYVEYNPGSASWKFKSADSKPSPQVLEGNIFTNKVKADVLKTSIKILQATLILKLMADPSYNDPVEVQRWNKFFISHGAKTGQVLEVSNFRYSVRERDFHQEKVAANFMPITNDDLYNVMANINNVDDMETFLDLVQAHEESNPFNFGTGSSIQNTFNYDNSPKVVFGAFDLTLNGKLRDSYYKMKTRVISGDEPSTETSISATKR